MGVIAISIETLSNKNKSIEDSVLPPHRRTTDFTYFV